RQRVEKGRLADVGEPHDPDGKSHARHLSQIRTVRPPHLPVVGQDEYTVTQTNRDSDSAAAEGLEDAPDGRAARAERRRAERREAILSAAKTVFRDKGYHQASVHDIIDEAQIARGTFYLYFSSKDRKSTRLNSSHVKISYAV